VRRFVRLRRHRFTPEFLLLRDKGRRTLGVCHSMEPTADKGVMAPGWPIHSRP